VPPTPWAETGTMRNAATAPLIESLTSIGPPFYSLITREAKRQAGV
jgi:hypothetical protein